MRLSGNNSLLLSGVISSLLCNIGVLGKTSSWSSTAFVTTHGKRSTIRNDLASSSSSLHASRSICLFEKDDFALETGEWPYTAADMGRVDTSDDSYFYDSPRFVTHIDDRAIESLTAFYREELAALALRKENGGNIDVLDLCSSWISHLPKDEEVGGIIPYGRIVGVGMNEEELQENPQLTEYFVQDMNKNPSLSQFDDDSFDAIMNVVSVDYLTKPKEIFQEMYRILRPGGIALCSFSNRCFPTKAVAMWLQADDIGRMTIVGSYYHYSANWKSIEALDIKLPTMETPERPSFGEMFSNPTAGFAWMNTAAAVAKSNAGDPMFVVKGTK
mmetsp:Transcript_25629/g.36132  ORF Transcript_25629/g.36132 Transcript_25629/m.36132 type:complete len:330 (-) Transcript_25629:131-1120(-)